MQNYRTKKGFNYSILALILFVLAFIFQFIATNMQLEFMNMYIAIIVLLSFLVAIIGGIYLILGLREESSKEQIIGLIISSIFLMIITYLVILFSKEI